MQLSCVSNITSEGKSRGGSKGGSKGGPCGGVNDPRVAKARAKVEELLDEPEIDKDAIEAAMKELVAAFAKKEKARKGKSDSGKKTGKYVILNEVFLIISITHLITLLSLSSHIQKG